MAAAAREWGGVCDGDCDCDMVRGCCSTGGARGWRGVAVGEGEEGGSEFRSGGMVGTAKNGGLKDQGR